MQNCAKHKREDLTINFTILPHNILGQNHGIFLAVPRMYMEGCISKAAAAGKSSQVCFL